jgi:hypothetical protein
MSFLAPLFFVALAGLAIPVLIHLIQREKKQVVQFPSLMFVRRVPYKSIRRRRIHNWLLLIVRMAAMALIILAFARPFLSRPNTPTVPGTGAREVVILLDQSYSMAYGDRWQRAQAAARDAIDGLAASDRGSMVLFSSGAEIALSSTAERDRLRAVVDLASPGAGATRYSPALKVAGGILAESTLPRREVVLISDFQRGGWRGEEGSRLPQDTTLTPVVIGGSTDQPNVSVTAVSLARSTFSNQERTAVTAAVVNRSSRPVAGSAISLEIDGRPVQTTNVNIDASGSTSVTFSPVTVTARNIRASVRVASDALPIDNAFNFVVSPTLPVNIVLVDRGTGGATLFLTRVLSIGDMPRFETTVRQPDAVSDEDLRRAAVVIVNDVAVPIGLARRLTRFVEGGGGLFVAVGSRTTWPQEADLLPAVAGAPVDRTRGEAARLGALEYGHPVFEIFRAPRSGDFSTARFYGYRAVVPAEDTQILARFDGGAPALIERRFGRGRVLAWASTLDLSWSDLPLKPVFLPFVHRAVRHLAAYSEPAPWLTVGQVLDPGAGAQGGGRVALAPSGRRIPLDEEGTDVLELTEQGFYEVRRGGQGSNAQVTVVASNVDPSESDLTPMDPQEIVAATVGGPAEAGTARASAPLPPEAQERTQRLWWYLLCLGIALLAADTVLSNRLSKA